MNVSRYTKQTNTELRFDVEFITPTFLGGADGNAEIRTAPFKNLLRRWWRIANGNLSPEELWQKESELFGSTEKNPKTGKTFGKSKVMFGILDSNNVRYINEKIDIGKDEYTNLAMYAGYGSANSGKNYIAPKSRCSFVLTIPAKEELSITKTLFYIHLFGTLGSRSRNGFGSISIMPKNFKFDPKLHFPLPVDFEKALSFNKNYPFCVGKDKNGMLCWKTENCTSWQEAFEITARIYHQLVVDLKKDDKNYKTRWRNLLGYATKNSRLPSQLILKICKFSSKNSNGILKDIFYGQVFHLPYSVDDWKKEDGNQLEAWKFIHEWLDGESSLDGSMGRKIGGTAK